MLLFTHAKSLAVKTKLSLSGTPMGATNLDCLADHEKQKAPCHDSSHGALQKNWSAVALFLDLRCLAPQVAQVVQLGATDIAVGFYFDLFDHWRMQRERTLDSNAEGNLANREGAANARAVDTDANALEDLNARAIAFNDVHVNFESIAGAEGWDVVAALVGGDLINDVSHGFSSLVLTSHNADIGVANNWGGRVWVSLVAESSCANKQSCHSCIEHHKATGAEP